MGAGFRLLLGHVHCPMNAFWDSRTPQPPDSDCRPLGHLYPGAPGDLWKRARTVFILRGGPAANVLGFRYHGSGIASNVAPGRLPAGLSVQSLDQRGLVTLPTLRLFARFAAWLACLRFTFPVLSWSNLPEFPR